MQQGDTALVSELNTFLCTAKKNGTLAALLQEGLRRESRDARHARRLLTRGPGRRHARLARRGRRTGGHGGGRAAARRAALSVALVDERLTLGGQIYKQPGPGFEVTDPPAIGSRQFRQGGG